MQNLENWEEEIAGFGKSVDQIFQNEITKLQEEIRKLKNYEEMAKDLKKLFLETQKIIHEKSVS